MSRQRIIIAAVLTALCAGAVVLLEFARPTSYVRIEYQLRDLVARLGRTTPANPDLVFLAIDSDSVDLDENLDLKGLFSSSASNPKCRRALEIMAQGWPWDREIYGIILERLIEAGAQVVVFDCLFPGPAPGDDSFRAALDRFQSKVVIGSNFVTPIEVDRSGRIPSSFEPPAETLIPRASPADDRVGFTNFFAGENNLVRAAQFRLAFGEADHSPSNYFSISARAAAKAGRANLVPNGLTEYLFRFTGPPRIGFRPHPLFEIFVPEYWEHNYQSGKFFRNKVVVIGAEGKWQKDELATPFGSMPGAELHLNALNALWHGEFLKELTSFGDALIIVVAALLGSVVCLSVRSPWLRLIALLSVDGVTLLCALWLFNTQGVYFPYLASFLALNSNVLFCFVSDFTFERIEKSRLRATLKTRDDLTHMIVHDLRSPLTVVKGYVDVLAHTASTKLTPDEVRCVAEVQRGADDLRDMISTLLDVGRLEADEMPLQLRGNDISAIAQKAANRFKSVLNERTLECDVPGEPVIVSCDADIIRRVLENLINNAIKFTKRDGAIVVSVEANAADVTVSVIDNGEGISPDQHERIFEKFGQTSTGSQRQNSTGIGLAFCRLAVEAHGGKIGVESETGNGSTFWFKLPLHAPVSHAAKTAKTIS